MILEQDQDFEARAEPEYRRWGGCFENRRTSLGHVYDLLANRSFRLASALGTIRDPGSAFIRGYDRDEFCRIAGAREP